MTEEKEQYNLFDGDDKTFTSVRETNANIREVCRPHTQATFKSDSERLYYAQLGDIPPTRYDEGGEPVYVFDNVWMHGTLWAAVAQQLFYDFPTIVKIKKGKPVVVNSDLFDNLDRGEVRRAFSDFLGKFETTPFGVKSLLDLLDSGQIRTIMQTVQGREESIQAATLNSEET